MQPVRFNLDGINVSCTGSNITIFNSYKIPNDNIEDFCISLRKELFKRSLLYYRRTPESWKREIYTHNLLYKLHIKEEQTKDTDLTEEEGKYRILGYNIIYSCKNIIEKLIK